MSNFSRVTIDGVHLTRVPIVAPLPNNTARDENELTFYRTGQTLFDYTAMPRCNTERVCQLWSSATMGQCAEVLEWDPNYAMFTSSMQRRALDRWANTFPTEEREARVASVPRVVVKAAYDIQVNGFCAGFQRFIFTDGCFDEPLMHHLADLVLSPADTLPFTALRRHAIEFAALHVPGMLVHSSVVDARVLLPRFTPFRNFSVDVDIVPHSTETGTHLCTRDWMGSSASVYRAQLRFGSRGKHWDISGIVDPSGGPYSLRSQVGSTSQVCDTRFNQAGLMLYSIGMLGGRKRGRYFTRVDFPVDLDHPERVWEDALMDEDAEVSQIRSAKCLGKAVHLLGGFVYRWSMDVPDATSFDPLWLRVMRVCRNRTNESFVARNFAETEEEERMWLHKQSCGDWDPRKYKDCFDRIMACGAIRVATEKGARDRTRRKSLACVMANEQRVAELDAIADNKEARASLLESFIRAERANDAMRGGDIEVLYKKLLRKKNSLVVDLLFKLLPMEHSIEFKNDWFSHALYYATRTQPDHRAIMRYVFHPNHHYVFTRHPNDIRVHIRSLLISTVLAYHCDFVSRANLLRTLGYMRRVVVKVVKQMIRMDVLWYVTTCRRSHASIVDTHSEDLGELSLCVHSIRSFSDAMGRQHPLDPYRFDNVPAFYAGGMYHKSYLRSRPKTSSAVKEFLDFELYEHEDSSRLLLHGLYTGACSILGAKAWRARPKMRYTFPVVCKKASTVPIVHKKTSAVLVPTVESQAQVVESSRPQGQKRGRLAAGLPADESPAQPKRSGQSTVKRSSKGVKRKHGKEEASDDDDDEMMGLDSGDDEPLNKVARVDVVDAETIYVKMQGGEVVQFPRAVVDLPCLAQSAFVQLVTGGGGRFRDRFTRGSPLELEVTYDEFLFFVDVVVQGVVPRWAMHAGRTVEERVSLFHAMQFFGSDIAIAATAFSLFAVERIDLISTGCVPSILSCMSRFGMAYATATGISPSVRRVVRWAFPATWIGIIMSSSCLPDLSGCFITLYSPNLMVFEFHSSFVVSTILDHYITHKLAKPKDIYVGASVVDACGQGKEFMAAFSARLDESLRYANQLSVSDERVAALHLLRVGVKGVQTVDVSLLCTGAVGSVEQAICMIALCAAPTGKLVSTFISILGAAFRDTFPSLRTRIDVLLHLSRAESPRPRLMVLLISTTLFQPPSALGVALFTPGAMKIRKIDNGGTFSVVSARTDNPTQLYMSGWGEQRIDIGPGSDNWPQKAYTSSFFMALNFVMGTARLRPERVLFFMRKFIS